MKNSRVVTLLFFAAGSLCMTALTQISNNSQAEQWFTSMALAQQKSPSSFTRSLVDKKGTADDHDAKLVAQALDEFPPAILKILKERGIRIEVCRGSIVDNYPEWKGQRPQAYPDGYYADNIAGIALTSNPAGMTVTIAIIGHPLNPRVPGSYEGGNSENVLLHEVMHTIDYTENPPRHMSAEFRKVYDADYESFRANDYFNTRDDRALREWYAESATRYYVKSATGEYFPHSMSYWKENPLMRVTALSSGSYYVEADNAGKIHPSTWNLTVSGNQISGISEWVEPNRKDQLKGRIDGNRVTIERDCTGQGMRGECHQVYSGTIGDGIIEGFWSGTGARPVPDKVVWKLYLKPRQPK